MKVISVENVSKKFILTHGRPKNLADAARNILKRQEREDFWAIKDVSFEVKQGEALGIIGHNGAGKSTMLKLLTRIMQPTSGRIRTRGRVSALIEVGAGFHPEMTGRENIYLNGSILGMTRREIDTKFDEIVAFAELEKFIDTPVKRYSSGMYARLGFAVAAHVEPEILIVDEVLSVGDAAFQERCTKRMLELRESDKTIVFVSHNMGAVASLCDKVAILNHGEVHSITDPQSAIKTYNELLIRSKQGRVHNEQADNAQISQSPLQITSLDILNKDKDWIIRAGESLELRIGYSVTQLVLKPRIGIQITDSIGKVLLHVSNALSDNLADINKPGYCNVRIKSVNLVPGLYSVVIKAADTYGSVIYDDGIISQELTIYAPDYLVDTGAARFGQVWAESDWSYF